MEIHLLQDIVIIFALSSLVNLLFQRIKVPTIVGFLVTGILAGPHGFGIVQHSHELEMLAEIGVILLLFTIGMEFSLKSLLEIKRTVLLGGSLQVGLCILLSFGIGQMTGMSRAQAVFAGFLVALSSTAIVLKILQEKAQISSQHGRTSLGILIFQDIIIVPMILFTPIIAGKSGDVLSEVLILLAKAVGLIAVTIVGARWLVPKLLHRVAQTQNQELFLLTVLVLGFAVAWFTASLGLSLALGAFLAGLTISESEYSHHAFGNVIPFRDIFTSFFFVSIGMLLNLDFLVANPLLIFGVTLIVLLLKGFIIGMVSFFLGLPFKTTVIVGLALSQIGEFSFILSKIGVENGLLSNSNYQLFLAVSVATMALSPFIIQFSPRFADLLLKLPLPKKLVNGLRPVPEITRQSLKNHLIIIGFGVNGKNVARAAQRAGIDYVVIDTDAELVRREKAKGEPVFFGDASKMNILQHAAIEQAEVLVVAIREAASTYSIAQMARHLNPKLHIIIRTRYVEDVEDLYKAGANEVIPEEFETSVEIFTRVLVKYLVPHDEIDKLVDELRADGYDIFRRPEPTEKATVEDLQLQFPNIEISPLRVHKASSVEGLTLSDIKLRSHFGVTLLAIRRDKETITNPSGNEKLCANDTLYVLGEPSQVLCASRLFSESEEPGCQT